MRKDQIRKKAKEFFAAKPGTPVCFITSDGNIFPGNYERFARSHAREKGHEVHRFTRDEVEIAEIKEKKGESGPEEKDTPEIDPDRVERVVEMAVNEGVVERKNNTLYYGDAKIGATTKKQVETFKADLRLLDHLEAELDLDNRGLGENEQEAG